MHKCFIRSSNFKFQFMLSIQRNFHLTGELTIKKGNLLKDNILPKDDPVNWLFLIDNEGMRLSFVYVITSSIAEYGKAFEIKMAFTIGEKVKSTLQTGNVYPVLRGEEPVGDIRILEALQENQYKV